MKNIVILTGNHLRHDFMRKAIALSQGIRVLRSYCETKTEIVQQSGESALARQHLHLRDLSEQDFFGSFVSLAPDQSHPVFIENGAINHQHIVDEITDLSPEVIIAYGCSLVKSALLERFKDRFLNVHLGLSPYYRGTATNFWPLVNGEPEFVGATFMHIDAGVDTGDIIHQIRTDIHPNDTPHQIGNRLITQIPSVYAEIIRKIDVIKAHPHPVMIRPEKYYRRSDFSEVATQTLYDHFAKGLIERYLNEKEERTARAPLVLNPVLI